jgi:hypothetical protein
MISLLKGARDGEASSWLDEERIPLGHWKNVLLVEATSF